MKILKSKLPKITLKLTKTDIPRVKISTSHDVYDYALRFWGDDIELYESMFILLLNRANNTIGYVKISQGGIDGTVVDNKLITKYAIESLASGVIMIHNHPSGRANPSNGDKSVTKKIKKGLSIFDIHLLDHIIVTPDTYYSFADQGTLNI